MRDDFDLEEYEYATGQRRGIMGWLVLALIALIVGGVLALSR